jgi:tetratricopeptide (TPR) repeat protein
LILANCFLSIGNKDQDALKVLLDLDKNNHSTSGKIKNLIGTIYWKLGDEDKAFTYLQHALDFEPKLADAKFNMGKKLLISSYSYGKKRR